MGSGWFSAAASPMLAGVVQRPDVDADGAGALTWQRYQPTFSRSMSSG